MDKTDILIVEDSPTQAEKLRYVLSKNNYEVQKAANGKKAISLLKTTKPKLVISDIIMPEMNGFELCRYIKKDKELKNIPVILLTSLSELKDIIKGLECGADNFVLKPFEKDNLLSKIEYVLNNRVLIKDDSCEPGVELLFERKKYIINSNKRQILDLLISTYKNVINKNEHLKKVQLELEELNQQLELKVEERTAELKQEIVERIKAEESLRIKDNAIESSFNAIVIVNLDNAVSYINNSFLKLWRYEKPDEVIGRSFISFWNDQEKVKGIVKEAFTEKGWLGELCALTKNGKVKIVQASLSVVNDNSADPVYLMGSFIDVTGQKANIEKIKTTISLLNATLESTTDGILVTDRKGNIVNYNQNFLKLWISMYKLDEILNNKSSFSTFLSYIKNSDKIVKRVNELNVQYDTASYDLLKLDDNKIYECYSNPQRLDGKIIGRVWSFRDITEKERAKETEKEKIQLQADLAAHEKVENEIWKALEKEKELNDLKSKFISMVSHEFRTPLTVIQSSAQLIERNINRWDIDKEISYLHIIENSIKNMTNMLNEVLTLSRLDIGKTKVKLQEINLKILIKNIIKNFQSVDNDNHLIKVNFPGECKTCVLDEKFMRHIITNLLSNALKYSPHGTDIILSVACNENGTNLRITDHGIGIPEKDQKHLFEPFHRAENVANIHGTGLGLSIIKNYVQLMHGAIKVESKIGEGTTFIINIPVQEINSQ